MIVVVSEVAVTLIVDADHVAICPGPDPDPDPHLVDDLHMIRAIVVAHHHETSIHTRRVRRVNSNVHDPR